MADSTLDDQLFVLYDNWPGEAERTASSFVDFVSTSADHNVSTLHRYAPGQKIQVWCDGADGNAGWATLIYLKGLAVTEANPTCAAKQFVVPSNASDIYQVTNDPDQALIVDGCGLAAVMLSVMTFTHAVTKYGWFWCGGVCPVDYVSDLDGDYATINTVAIGPIVIADIAADAIGLAEAATLETHIGFSYAADA